MPAKLLVVDDEADLELLIRQKFRHQIRNGDIQFVFARSGVEALQKLAEDSTIDLVLTDINMPEMDGLTLLQKLNELNRLLKAIIVSAYGDMENIRTAMNRGASDFVTKPIDFQDLEITINKTLRQLEELKRAVTEHDQLVTIHKELDIASHIQQSILPRKFPPFPGRSEFDIFATMLPAREVGGDFYDFFLIGDDRLGCVIGDVSGKGIPAALSMAVSRTLLRSTALSGTSPAQCLEQVNTLLCLENSEDMFVTIFYGVLNTRSGVLKYANGGHNPPYLLRQGGTVEPLPSTGGTVLGAIEGLTYRASSITLQVGDRLLLYTDGVTEAMDDTGTLYSEQRLQQLLRALDAPEPESLVHAVVEEVKRHAGTAPQHDDITVLAIRRNEHAAR